MPWINNTEPLQYYLRELDFNRSICLTGEFVERLADRFDSVLGSFVDFRNEISSLYVYPFDILPRDADNINILKTSRGEFADITAYKLDAKNCYMTLGELYIAPYYNNFADYRGYTQIKVFLPILGFIEVDVNEVMGKWLQIRLAVDYNTGKGTYIIGVSATSITISNPPYPSMTEDNTLRIIGTYECVVGIEIPLGQSNIGEIKRNLMLGTIKTAATLASAYYGMSLPAPKTTTKSTKTYDIKGSKGKQLRSGTVEYEKTTTHTNPKNKVAPVVDVFDSAIDVLNRNYNGSSSDRVNDAMLMWKCSSQVQVVIYRPKFVDVGNEFAHLYGHPLGEVKYLQALSGYTEVSNIHFEGVGFDTITQDEVEMLEDIFEEGIYL